ncbi:MAG: prolipoprotein diacylglyceryl transferase [Phycisphaeraceae bacterium]|nr:prolipoprotein diacylglyceryl transferase [Phycisphaeraceae bacterium]
MTPAWLHTLDPFLWQISPGFGVRWYGLSYAVGFVLAYLALRFLSRRGATAIPSSACADVVMIAAIAVVIGGRLGYVLIYQPSLMTSFSASPPWWGVLALHQGGMASHGGMVGMIVAAYLIARKYPSRPSGDPDLSTGERRQPFLSTLATMDVMVLMVPFGVFLARCANFINGELLGKIAAKWNRPAPWWAVKFPQEVIERPAELGQDQIDALTRAVGLRAPLAPADVGEFESRIQGLISSAQSGSREAVTTLEPLINARHPSQLYQAIAEGLVVGAIVWLVARSPRRAGLISAIALIAYGILRVLTEFVRLPDAHLATQRIAGLSRGQWLSVVMVMAGIGLMAAIRARNLAKVGGWGRRSTTSSAA